MQQTVEPFSLGLPELVQPNQGISLPLSGPIIVSGLGADVSVNVTLDSPVQGFISWATIIKNDLTIGVFTSVENGDSIAVKIIAAPEFGGEVCVCVRI